jgi:hypothetical protein
MRFIKSIIGLSLLVVAHAANTSAEEIQRVEWNAVPGATVYKGTIEKDGVPYLFSTDSTWVLVPNSIGTVKKVDAFSPRGPLDSKVKVEQSPLQSRPSDEPITAAPESNPESIPEPEAETPPEEAELPAEPVADTPTTDQTAAPKTPPEEDLTAFTRWSRVGVSIGMGRQWLKSEIGISEFKGGANIGGTILSGTSISADSPVWYEGEFSAHNFTTETQVAGPVAGAKSEETNTQMRLRLSAFYNFFQEVSSPLTGLSVGGGLQYLKHPQMIITDKLSGAAKMKTETALALNLGVRYAALLSIKNLLVTGADLTPFSISKDTKSLSTRLYTEWLHLITPSVYTNLGLQLGREKLTAKGECPAVTNCTEEGVTDSDLVQIRMGLAVGF